MRIVFLKYTRTSIYRGFRSLPTLNGGCPSTSRNVNTQGRTNYFQPSVSRLQVNALHAVFSMSGNECERCAPLLTLIQSASARAHLSSHSHHRGPLHETEDTARSVVTLLPDFLTRLQRLPLSPQAPHPRTPSTEPLYGGSSVPML